MSKANKFILNDEVLIDLTQDTVTEDDVIKGKIFHKADGEIATGTKEVSLQVKTVSPKATEQIVEPDAGQYGLSKVTIAPVASEHKEVTPTRAQQVVTASEANVFLNQVIVAPIPNQYIVPSGSFTIRENGRHDVKNAAYVTVAVDGSANIPEWDGSLTITKIEEETEEE